VAGTRLVEISGVSKDYATAEADWKTTLEIMKDRGLEGDRPPSAYYTNDFVPER